MTREVDIDYALSETLKSHPDFAPYLSNIIYKNIYSGTNPFNFTSRVRDSVSTAKQVDFVNYILDEAIVIYNAASILAEDCENIVDKENMTKHFPMFSHIEKAINIIKDKNNNAVFYYLCNRTELFELIEAICQTTFKRQWYLPGSAKTTRDGFHNQLGILADKDPSTKTLRRMLGKETKVVQGIRNLIINYEAINVCRREIMLGNQVRQAHNSYALGDCLFASQDIGKSRRNQEDSVLIQEHEENPNFKIMAVADGMGGLQAGEVASSYTVARLSEWFNSLSADFYDYPDQLQIMLANEIQKISKEVYNQLGSTRKEIKGGTTLTAAIVTGDRTIICSVGDSRAYTLKNTQLRLITQDESHVWDKLRESKKGQPITWNDVDNLRYDEDNNYITRCVGDRNLEYVQTRVIPNSDYDELLIFSDGVTDLLSSEDIRVIATTTAPKDLAEVFVQHALTHGVKEKLTGVDYEVEVVSPGKDNASAVAFIRR